MKKVDSFMVQHQVIMSNANVPTLSGATLLIACPVMIHNYGLDFYLDVWRHTQEAYPQFDIQLGIPCGENLGLALRAIFSGVNVIYLPADALAFDQVVDLAAIHGIQVLPQGELNG